MQYRPSTEAKGTNEFMRLLMENGVGGAAVGGLTITAKSITMDSVDKVLRMGFELSIVSPTGKKLVSAAYGELAIGESITIKDIGNAFNINLASA